LDILEATTDPQLFARWFTRNVRDYAKRGVFVKVGRG
jgi:hypothetical protein